MKFWVDLKSQRDKTIRWQRTQAKHRRKTMDNIFQRNDWMMLEWMSETKEKQEQLYQQRKEIVNTWESMVRNTDPHAADIKSQQQELQRQIEDMERKLSRLHVELKAKRKIHGNITTPIQHSTFHHAVQEEPVRLLDRQEIEHVTLREGDLILVQNNDNESGNMDDHTAELCRVAFVLFCTNPEHDNPFLGDVCLVSINLKDGSTVMIGLDSGWIKKVTLVKKDDTHNDDTKEAGNKTDSINNLLMQDGTINMHRVQHLSPTFQHLQEFRIDLSADCWKPAILSRGDKFQSNDGTSWTITTRNIDNENGTTLTTQDESGVEHRWDLETAGHDCVVPFQKSEDSDTLLVPVAWFRLKVPTSESDEEMEEDINDESEVGNSNDVDGDSERSSNSDNDECRSKHLSKQLVIASACGDVDSVKRLLEHQADVNMLHRDKDGSSDIVVAPLHVARTTEITKLLLTHGADIEQKDGTIGRRPLGWATRNGTMDTVKLLLERGANVHAVNNQGETVLHDAAESGEIEIAELLLDQGVEVDMADSQGQTPLRFAANLEHVGVVKLLLERGASTNVFDDEGMTPLQLAALKNYPAVVGVMLDLGVNVDVDAPDNEGKTPLSLAANCFSPFANEFLQVRGAGARQVPGLSNWICMSEAAPEQTEVALRLLERGAKVDLADDDGYTPLSWAAFCGNIKLVELLVSRGADVNSASKYKWTPLHIAAAFDREKIVECLLEHGSDVNAVEREGKTPLHWAMYEGNTGVAQLLIDRGAIVDSVDIEGKTPLHFVLEHHYICGSLVVEFLLKNGASVVARDQEGKTPLYYGALLGKRFSRVSCNIVRMLLNWGTCFDDGDLTPEHEQQQQKKKRGCDEPRNTQLKKPRKNAGN